MLDLVFALGTGLYLLGGLALVLLGLVVDHVLFRRRVDGAVEEMRAAGSRSSRPPVFDVEVDDDWRGFPA